MSVKNKWYLAICIFVTAALLVFAGFCFPALRRLVSAVVDLAMSLAYYGCNLFVSFSSENNPITPTVIQSPLESAPIVFPKTYDDFLLKIQGFGKAFISKDNFWGWIVHINNSLYVFSLVLVVVLPVMLVVALLFKFLLSGYNTEHDVKTKPLVAWLRFDKRIISPIKQFFRGFIEYVAERKFWRRLWLVILLVALNVITIGIEIIAYLFYLVSSFDFLSFYTQIYKLLSDLYMMYHSLPFVIWFIIGLVFVVWLRKRIGYRRLNHFEHCNAVFARSLGVCTMITGNMGKGKTKLMTSLNLTLSTMFKSDSKDILMQIERWFPNFPWATLQDVLKQLIERHVIYSLTSAELFVRKKRERFERRGEPSQLYGYDYSRYGLFYNNELQNLYLFEVLTDYCDAFFIYYMTKSMILGNYAIREDGVMQDVGNFPMWDYDFFERSPLYEADFSYYANILDFDILRKGKKIVKGSKLADTFEFGIVTITELDKERGNTLDTKELKKNVEEANQKNDLFNYSPKMGRHPATVMYKYFVRFLVDQQRAMKTDADFREICDKVINIEDVKERRLAMPLFFVEEILYNFIAPRYEAIYESYRFRRGDDSLLMYFLRNTLGRFVNWYERVYNVFGYDVLTLTSESGKLDGSNVTKDKWHLSYKKDLAHRYATDCYKQFFRDKSVQKNIGFADYKTFADVNASAEELLQMNSYFIRDMVDKICGDKE